MLFEIICWMLIYAKYVLLRFYVEKSTVMLKGSLEV